MRYFFLFFVVFAQLACNIGKTDEAGNADTLINIPGNQLLSPQNDTTVLTIAYAVEDIQSGTVSLVFKESPRIFFLPRSAVNFSETTNKTKRFIDDKTPVKIIYNATTGIISYIDKASEKESALLRRVYENAIPGDKLCEGNAVDMAAAKEIFEYCANQRCPAPANAEVNVCIPFQFLADGCYSRAHKMRAIIKKKYQDICINKIFSFAESAPTKNLRAMVATKPGSCCMGWAYHVAIVIKVKDGPAITDYVIDPGMFDSAVTVQQWLEAQEMKCIPENMVNASSKGKVKFHLIRSGEAFFPTDFTGREFTTDPQLEYTDWQLKKFHSVKSCQ